MRIGIMLRSLDERFGIGIYTRYIIDALLDLDSKHDYVFFYRNKNHLGKYAHCPNVEEKVVKAPHKFLWDQVAIPLAAKAARIDVIFHPKFTVPLLAGCKTVMVLHGSGWFFYPEFYGKIDIEYVKVAMPLYCRRANAIISNSNLTTNDFVKVLNVPREKIETITPGLNPIFRQISDQDLLYDIKEKYGLPNRFMLTVGRYTPRKNFETALRAFARCRKVGGLKLVAIGDFKGQPGLDQLLSESDVAQDVIFTGYIEQADLPAIYNLADVFIFPSVYEELGIPLIEAMACGCPIVASNVAAIPEISGNAALLTDPFDADGMAKNIDLLTEDSAHRQKLIDLGLNRVAQFGYDRAAKLTLSVLERVGAGS